MVPRKTKRGWDKLCGKHVLKGISTDICHPFDKDAGGVAVELEKLTFLVFEDPSDGYRSAAFEPLVISQALWPYACGRQTALPPTPVHIRRWTSTGYSQADGIAIHDAANGQVIALIGTSNTDDYYPCFTAAWRPHMLATNGGPKWTGKREAGCYE